ncbi:MAG TPA: cbb3-type cytochrome c oxidase subunit I [Burkholderiales bacterium]|nr:cbb3-type cytochrome c oxidase subunit I [Burkholderiales bacterium]
MRMTAALRPVLDLPARLGLSRARDVYYALPVPLADERRALAVAWLALGLAALIASGIFSLLLVAARAPFLAPLFPVADFFHVALVVHVDLSVLVWFAACAGLVWTVSGAPRFASLGWASLAFAVVGTMLMSVAPFLGRGQPVMSNYVPVLDDPLFLAGLVVFGLGFAGVTLRALAGPARVGRALDGVDAQRFGLNAAAVSAAIAAAAFAWSWLALPDRLAGERYYELLFWGGGHVLQFTWTLLMLVAWLWLATLAGLRPPLGPRVATLLFGVALAAVFATPAIYLAWPVTSIEHRQLFTWLMRFGGGLAILPLGLAVVAGLVRAGPGGAETRPLRAALWASLGLFAAGGAIGFVIQGSDVRVPAHYHGSIVGVTLALMGLAYALVPRLGLGRPPAKLATLQPFLYGGGQLLHIMGLMWSGGYGVQRKVAGGAQVLRTTQEVIGMGVMGIGGLIAVIGGVLFVVVIARAMLGRR